VLAIIQFIGLEPSLCPLRLSQRDQSCKERLQRRVGRNPAAATSQNSELHDVDRQPTAETHDLHICEVLCKLAVSFDTVLCGLSTNGQCQAMIAALQLCRVLSKKEVARNVLIVDALSDQGFRVFLRVLHHLPHTLLQACGKSTIVRWP
jgi:hypothetical protein